MSVQPRPEFGRPETGQVRYWYRTDAQMRRARMTPEDRAAEAKRIGERRRQVKAEREAWKADAERRARHGPTHRTCRDCIAGLHDVGIRDGRPGDPHPVTTDEVVCCTCTRPFRFSRGIAFASKDGPNAHLFRCRVLNPDDGRAAELAS